MNEQNALCDRIQILTRAMTIETVNAERDVRILSVDNIIANYKKFYAALMKEESK
jgi:hypothetical protein